MAKFQISEKAWEDIASIWNYTLDVWSEEQGDKYYNMLLDACEEIAENPAIGKHYKEISEELFGISVGRHIIFYRKTFDGSIEIVRFLHQQMDLKNRIKE